MKPGPVGRHDDLLAELRRRASRIVGSVASVVAPPADELDQRHDRHRAEEVHADEPLRAAPAETASASRSIEIELVFVAKIVAAGARASRSRPERRLHVDVLEDGLDDEVGVGDRARDASVGLDPGEGRVRARRLEMRPFATDRARLSAIRSRPAVGARELGLVQRRRACRPPHGPARCRGPSGRRRRRRRVSIDMPSKPTRSRGTVRSIGSASISRSAAAYGSSS